MKVAVYIVWLRHQHGYYNTRVSDILNMSGTRGNLGVLLLFFIFTEKTVWAKKKNARIHGKVILYIRVRYMYTVIAAAGDLRIK